MSAPAATAADAIDPIAALGVQVVGMLDAAMVIGDEEGDSAVAVARRLGMGIAMIMLTARRHPEWAEALIALMQRDGYDDEAGEQILLTLVPVSSWTEHA